MDPPYLGLHTTFHLMRGFLCPPLVLVWRKSLLILDPNRYIRWNPYVSETTGEIGGRQYGILSKRYGVITSFHEYSCVGNSGCDCPSFSSFFFLFLLISLIVKTYRLLRFKPHIKSLNFIPKPYILVILNHKPKSHHSAEL